MGMNSNPFQARLQEIQGSPKEVESKTDPFSERLNKKEEVSESLWNGFYDMVFSPEETPFDQGVGQALRSVSTSILGFPGDMVQMVKGASNWLEKKIQTPKMFQRDPNVLQKFGKNALEKIPSTGDLMEKFDKLTDNKYEPKSEQEALLQEIGSDVASLMIPARSVGGVFKALSGSILGNLAKEGVKGLDYGGKSQAAAKIGTMMAVSMINPKGADKYVDHLYNKAYSNLPKDAVISSERFSKDLINLKEDLKRGLVNVESKKPVLNAIRDVERNIKDGSVKIRDLTEAKKNLNEQRAAKIYDPEFKGGKKARESLKKNYGKLANAIDRSIEEYGKTNETFFRPYKEAQQGWAGIEQSKRASEFLKRTIKNYKLGSSISTGLALKYFPQIGIGSAVGAYSGLKSYEMMHRVFMNPTLRKYYMQTLIEASKDNAPGVIKNLKKMNDDLEKENH